ncbi:MAG: DUF2188 domain-containing protein [Nodosilinea sp. WJT8-NPBG4]|jgi:hypothetical protein|nr:DUF2188 domain-containing protein [Nodosilinea sp. WJT8-NPBG4]
MAGSNGRTVYRRSSDDKWVNKKNGNSQASSVHDTQKDANAAAKDMLKNSGGGELITKGKDGKIRSKDTIVPGNDPRSIKDTEH